MRPDTANQMPATGLNEGARMLVVRAVIVPQGLAPEHVVAGLFRRRFNDWDDYLDLVDATWGHAARYRVEFALQEVVTEAQTSFMDPDEKMRHLAIAGLKTMPEGDFLSAIESAIQRASTKIRDEVDELMRIRGAPWRLGGGEAFVWVGDELTDTAVLHPALSSLDDPRFAPGVKVDFEAARAALRRGDPSALKQVVTDSASSVEAALKVVLDARQIPYRPTATAQPLFDLLEREGVVPRWMEKVVLAPSMPRNKSGGHGAPVAHDVKLDEAQGTLVAAASAIGYLASKLP